MTIKELYEMAVERGCEDAILQIRDDDSDNGLLTIDADNIDIYYDAVILN